MLKRFLIASILLTAFLNSNASQIETKNNVVILQKSNNKCLAYNKPTKEYLFFELHADRKKGETVWVLMDRKLSPKSIKLGKRLIWNDAIKNFVPLN